MGDYEDLPIEDNAGKISKTSIDHERNQPGRSSQEDALQIIMKELG